MARRGDVLENPWTGERIVFVETAADTDGELLRYEVFFRPRGLGTYSHVHPHQRERHEVLSGNLRVAVAGREQTLKAGDAVEVPAGAPHRIASGDDVHALFEFRPALRWEVLYETLLGLARDGKTGRLGYPKILQMAVIAQEYERELQLAWPPPGVQRALLALPAMLGRMLGYRARYEEYSGP